jgi:cobyrinic acid a,c-diamide synthase
VRIAIARDRAFGFYYPGDLEALEAAGAELVPFDTLSDSKLPEVDGLFIGGGFPETSLDRLAANHALKADIRAAIEGGLPTYAECGGLMYLCKRLHWRDTSGEMVGVIPADVRMEMRRSMAADIGRRRPGRFPGPRIPLLTAGRPARRADLRLRRRAWLRHRG